MLWSRLGKLPGLILGLSVAIALTDTPARAQTGDWVGGSPFEWLVPTLWLAGVVPPPGSKARIGVGPPVVGTIILLTADAQNTVLEVGPNIPSFVIFGHGPSTYLLSQEILITPGADFTVQAGVAFTPGQDGLITPLLTLQPKNGAGAISRLTINAGFIGILGAGVVIGDSAELTIESTAPPFTSSALLGSGILSNEGHIVVNPNSAIRLDNCESSAGSITLNGPQPGADPSLRCVTSLSVTGGTFTVQNAATALTVFGDVSDATALVSGAGSKWTMTETLTLNSGTLTVTNDALLETETGLIGFVGALPSTVLVSAGGSWTTGDLEVGGSQQGILNIDGGTVTVTSVAADAVEIGGDSALGTVTVSNNGTLNSAGDITIGEFEEGVLTSKTGGQVLAPGKKVFVKSQGTLKGGVVEGEIVENGGRVLPGDSPGMFELTGDYLQEPGGTLEIEIDGTTPGTGYDQLLVDGDVTLDGNLDIRVSDPFLGVIQVSDDFLFIDATGTLSGSFANVQNGTVVIQDEMGQPAGTMEITETSCSGLCARSFMTLPEPGAALSLGAGIGLLALLARSRARP